ncbi:hypothetical protein SNE40_004517 [Patella caerulea]|uniref:Beta-hexosaminidase n=1 Tax=Patella caerulea TaxID=87958 RepID=A0AAN8PXA3_PATCE
MEARHHLYLLVVAFVFYEQPVLAVSADQSSVVYPWPEPTFYYAKEFFYLIDTDHFDFRATNNTCNILKEAFRRYAAIILGSAGKEQQSGAVNGSKSTTVGDSVAEVMVQVNTPCNDGDRPNADSDESYYIAVNAAALVMANEVWGAMRGLETFSQMIYQGDMGRLIVNESEVTDKPRFGYRGILIDTSNHFISVPILLQNLDAMELNKFNVFHWHIVDDISFPYQSEQFPNLSDKGAYNKYTHVYSKTDVMQVIEYGRLRGIRVIVEFDTPGHTLSWGKGQPDLLTKCYTGDKPNGQFGPINPILQSAYTFLDSLFAEIGRLFPDDYIHIGGNDVNFSCWESNPEIKEFMKQMNYTALQLEQYYFQKVLNIVRDLYRKNIVWQDVYDNGVLSAGTIYQVWKSDWQSTIATLTAAAYETILSSCWFLDNISNSNEWIKYYQCEPYDFKGSMEDKQRVKGGEAILWSTYVDDTNLMTKIWPGASAVGERLWSDISVNNVTAAFPRLIEHHCRMVRRGISAEPLGPGYCIKEYKAPV